MQEFSSSHFDKDYSILWGYENPTYWDEHIVEAFDVYSGEEPRKILDIGCSAGFKVRKLIKAGHDCVGVDFSEHFSDFWTEEEKDIFVCKSINDYIREVECNFDVVLCWNIFQFLSPSQLTEMLLWIREGKADIILDWCGTHGEFQYERDGRFYNRITKKCGFGPHDLINSVAEATQNGYRGLSPSKKPLCSMVSVVIPFKNRFDQVVRASNSVLKQTHKAIELILVNDHSDHDFSRIALASSKWPVDTTVMDTEVDGASAARNVGLQEAVGDWVLFFDSDDTMSKNFVETLVNKTGNSDVIYADRASLKDVELEKQYKVINSAFCIDIENIRYYPEFDSDKIKHMNTVAMPALINRKFLDECGEILDEELERYIDWDFWLRLSKAGGKFTRSESAWFWYNQYVNVDRVSSRDPNEAVSRIIDKGLSNQVSGVCFCSFSPLGEFDLNNATSRIRSQYIQKHIYGSALPESVYTLCDIWENFDIFVFTRLDLPINLSWFLFLKGKGKIVVYDETMPLWLNSNETMSLLCKIADLCIASSFEIEAQMKDRGANKTVVIEDGVDCCSVIKDRKRDYSLVNSICWFGYMGNVTTLMPFASELCRFCEENKQKVKIISDRPDYCLPFPTQFIEWDIQKINYDIVSSDIVLCPIFDFGRFQLKSRNKEYLSKSLAMPVIDNNFYKELSMLIESEQLRKEQGLLNFNWALQNCDSRLRAMEYCKAIHSI